VEEALALAPESRSAFIESACAGDAELRLEVEAQLRACEHVAGSSDFLDRPAAVFAASLLAHPAAGEPTGAQGENAKAFDPATLTVDALRTALAGRYDVEREIGRGGTATVYLARDRRHARLVALKILAPSIGAAMSAERFLQEIRVTAGLTHPHILPLHDSGTAAGFLYYVMPYVEGETLRERIARDGALHPDAALRLIREVASALAHAHRHGVVHRDIKPANILLQDEHAVVADFGIARAVGRARESALVPDQIEPDGPATLTGVGSTLGTPAYMSPEQALGGAVDHRTDIYALGLVAYEALAGEHPFGVRTPREMLLAHVEEAPTPLGARIPGVPPVLATLVMRALEKDPAARPQSAEEILATLDPMLDRSLLVVDESASRRRRWRGGRTVKVAAAIVALLAGGAAVVLGGRTADRETETTSASRGTSDQEAYDLYLEGRYYWLLRGADNVTRSIGYYRKAVEKDPGFARAYAGLSMAYEVLPNSVPDATDSLATLAMSSARRAVALDSTLGDAQLALGLALDFRLRFRDALVRYRKAVALDPGSETAHHWLGISLLNLGRTDEAIGELSRAKQLDPLAPAPASALSTALLFARRYPESLVAAHRALALDSTFAFAIWTLGVAQALDGQPDSAVRTLERGTRLHPDDSKLRGALVFAYAAAGRWPDAERVRAMLQRPGGDLYGGIDAAFAEMVFGNREPLLRLLTTAEGQRRYEYPGGVLGCDPLLDPLRSDTRFLAAMRSLGVERCKLVEAWPIAQRRDS
jgi:serine/threonine protein kinase/Flp pilus assembly protein TadD